MNTTFRNAVAGGVLALTVLGGGAVAVAQTPAGEALAEADPAPGGLLERLRERRAERRAEWTEALAAELGIEVQALRDARVAVVAPKLDEAVAAGRISRERADAIVEAIGSGQIPERP